MGHPRRILLALTSHGLGHLTRSLRIGRELRALGRRVELTVATTVPESRVGLELSPPFRYRPVGYEPGTVQRTCFEVDVEATRAAYARFLRERRARLDDEIAFLREMRCDGVVADIPALPVRAAGELGIPAVGVGNFTWDWALEPLFEDDPEVPETLAADYARGSGHLRLPFGPDTSPFQHSERAPLVSRRAELPPAEVRRRLDLPAAEPRPLVVVCPGGWDPDGWDRIHVVGCEGVRFVTVGDLPVTADVPLTPLPHALPAGIGFPDLVAAATAVVAKPGYGIASECVAHRTPLVAIERPVFRETPLLLDDFSRRGPVTRLTLDDFFAGRWEDALDELLARPAAWSEVPRDGARRVARRIAELLSLQVREDEVVRPSPTD